MIEAPGLSDFKPDEPWEARVTVKCGKVEATKKGDGHMIYCEVIEAPEDLDRAVGTKFSQYINPNHSHEFVVKQSMMAIKAFGIDKGDGYDPDDFANATAECGMCPKKNKYGVMETQFDGWILVQ